MPLYNDKDFILQVLIEETDDKMYECRQEISDIALELARLDIKKEKLEDKHSHLERQRKILEQIFKEYNVKENQ